MHGLARAGSFYQMVRWRKKLEAAGYVVTDEPLFPGLGLTTAPTPDDACRATTSCAPVKP